ncbi:MAG: chemotaxis protein CheR [Acidobacteria bacterium]|nr:chemotaxis protein CheR [Acidobacteriota bacterium]
MRLSEELCLQAQALIASRLGLDFSKGRQADLERGLVRACRTSSVSAPETYLAWLTTLPDESTEWRRLASHLTVGETYFFRDRALFEALEQQVIPSLISARRAEGTLRLRLWSAGCATGEEPYSLAILVDRLLPDCCDWALTILATDINPEALEAARRGCYREWSFRETPSWVLERYFHRRGAETFEVSPRVRRLVSFAPLNLAEDGYPSVVTNTSAMDLILCRNVLMYFTREAQGATVARLKMALVPNGWLIVSPAEASAELFRPLLPVNFSGAILYRKEQQSALSGQLSAVSPTLSSWQAETVLPDPSTPLPYVEMPAELVMLPSEGQAEARPPTATDLECARELADQGRLDQARKLCTDALARDRLNPEAHHLLAAICQEEGDIPAALGALRRAIYLAPDSVPSHFLLGSLLLRQGRRERGRRSMETVVSLLSSVPRDEAVAGGGGLTAGRLLETARAYLEMSSLTSADG